MFVCLSDFGKLNFIGCCHPCMTYILIFNTIKYYHSILNNVKKTGLLVESKKKDRINLGNKQADNK